MKIEILACRNLTVDEDIEVKPGVKMKTTGLSVTEILKKLILVVGVVKAMQLVAKIGMKQENKKE